jgi:hypothetical protein
VSLPICASWWPTGRVGLRFNRGEDNNPESIKEIIHLRFNIALKFKNKQKMSICYVIRFQELVEVDDFNGCGIIC